MEKGAENILKKIKVQGSELNISGK